MSRWASWLGRLGLAKPGLGRDVLVLLGGNSAGQLVSVAAAPILTRLYDPFQYGIFTTLFAIAGVLITVGGLRLEFAIPIARSRRLALATTTSALFMVAVTTCLAALVCLLLRISPLQPSAAWPTWNYLWLLPIVGCAGGAANVLSYFAVREKAFGVISTARVAQSGGAAFAQLALHPLTHGPSGLILGDAAGRAVAAVWSWRFFRRERRAYPGRIGPAEMRAACSRFSRFARISAPATLLNSLCLMGPVVGFSLIYDTRVAGLVGVSQRVLGIPIALIGQSVAQAFLSHFASATRSRDSRLEQLYLRAAARLALVGLGPLLAAFFLAPSCVALALGKQWTEAGPVIQVLVPSLFFQLVVTPLSTVLSTIERNDLQLAWDAARLVGLVAIFGWAKTSGSGLSVVLMVFSAFMSLAYLAHFLVSWMAIRAHSGNLGNPRRTEAGAHEHV